MAIVKWPRLQQYDTELKQYIATHYEPRLIFDSTPVYSVTLAEDTSGPYVFTLQDEVANCIAAIYTPVDTQARSVACSAVLADGTTTQGCNVANVAGTSAGGGYWRFSLSGGLFDVAMSRYGTTTTGVNIVTSPTLVILPTNHGGIKSFSCGKSDGIFLAGTRFVVYAATEV